MSDVQALKRCRVTPPVAKVWEKVIETVYRIGWCSCGRGVRVVNTAPDTSNAADAVTENNVGTATDPCSGQKKRAFGGVLGANKFVFQGRCEDGASC